VLFYYYGLSEKTGRRIGHQIKCVTPLSYYVHFFFLLNYPHIETVPSKLFTIIYLRAPCLMRITFYSLQHITPRHYEYVSIGPNRVGLIFQIMFNPKPKNEEKFQHHHLSINGTKPHTWNEIKIFTVHGRSLGQFHGQVQNRWMKILDQIKRKKNCPKHPRSDLIAFKKWLKPLLFLAQIRVIEIPNPTRSFSLSLFLTLDPENRLFIGGA